MTRLTVGNGLTTLGGKNHRLGGEGIVESLIFGVVGKVFRQSNDDEQWVSCVFR